MTRSSQSCERLFAGTLVTIHILGEDGLTRIVTHQGPNRETFMASPPAPVTDQRATGICIQRRTVLHYPDTEDEAVPPGTREGGRLVGTRAAIFAPMLWEGRAIGVIAVCRVAPGPFSDKEIALLKTFADQAVIAIQNVRLFNETKEALERQTATAEVLRVISESPTDVQPVMEAVARRAGMLCRADGSRVWRVVDGQLRAMTSYGPAYEAMTGVETLPLATTSVGGRAVLERRTIHVEDVVPVIDSEYPDIGEIA